MKKYLLILLLVALSSCYTVDGIYCVTPSEYDRSLAEGYYQSFSSFRERISEVKAKKLFGCNFHRNTDAIYSYSTFWGKKYILVRYGRAVTWAE